MKHSIFGLAHFILFSIKKSREKRILKKWKIIEKKIFGPDCEKWFTRVLFATESEFDIRF